MIDGLNPYPAMKETGVACLGQLPEHWEVRRLRNAAEMRVSNVDKHIRDGEMPVRLCNYVDVYKHDRIRLQMPFMRATASSDEIARFRLESGDVLITKDSEAWNDIAVPALVEETADDLICGYHLALLRPMRYRLHGEYLFRALQSTGVAYQFHVEANGVTRYGLSHAAIKSIWLPLPPLSEQAAIVRFLGHANRRIERYIRAKKKLIALLNEQKQAIIHRAVTRGLDSNTKFKHSKSRWFLEIPENCTVVTLRRVIHSAIDGPHFSPRYLDRGIPFLSARNVKADRWSLEDAKFISESDYQVFSKRVRPEVGDVLYTKGGTTGVARVVNLTFPFQIWVHIAVLKLKRDRIHPEYLALVLNSPRCYEQSQLFTRGATNQDLGLGRMKNIELPLLSSVAAQSELVEDVRKKVQSQDLAIRRAEREITLIREYRTRLIADVVTGQLDVRAAAEKLPEEPREEDVELVEVSSGDEGEPSEFEDMASSGTIG